MIKVNTHVYISQTLNNITLFKNIYVLWPNNLSRLARSAAGWVYKAQQLRPGHSNPTTNPTNMKTVSTTGPHWIIKTAEDKR